MNSGIMKVFIGTGVRDDTHAAVYRVFFPPVLGSLSFDRLRRLMQDRGEKNRCYG